MSPPEGYAKFTGVDDTPLRPDSPRLAGQYAPVAPYVWIPSTELALAVASGTSRGSAASWPVILCDAAAYEGAGTSWQPPRNWATFHLDVWWVNAGAGTGDVDFGINFSTKTIGDTLAAGGAELTSNTAGAENVVMSTRLLTSRAVTVDEPELLTFYRAGPNVTDTLANDIGVVGFLLTRAT